MKKLVLLMIMVFVLSFSAYAQECTVDADCAEATCCHADSCVPLGQQPDCTEVVCTEVCEPGTMDCGQGSCQCIGSECTAVIYGTSPGGGGGGGGGGPAVKCCVEGNTCYHTQTGAGCEGMLYDGECTLADNCYVVHECYPGETIYCEEYGYAGEKLCRNDMLYTACYITDEEYLASIDFDRDGDPDSTDCEPEEPVIYWGHGCEEVFAPAPPNIVPMLAGIGALAIIIYLVWKYLKEKKPTKKAKKGKKK